MPPPFELESLVDIYDQPFVVVDHRFRVVAVNRAFELTYDVHRSTAKGSPCYSLIRGEHRPCPCDPEGHNCPFLQVFDGHHKKSTVRRYLDNEGREHIIRVQAYPLRSTTGEVYIGELIQHDAMRLHPAVDEGCNSGRMVGESPVFLEALDKLRSAAWADAPVLLLGETGTGKELAGTYVHRHSRRRDGPFQTLDCTALTNELFESEVFGHERGSFTGNVGEKTGLFELADGGTLFLDEIGEMPLRLQSKLLRVLESGQYRRVGGTKTRSANVRIVPLATANYAMPLTSAPISTFELRA
jgi:two-component system response regulator AtoC